MSTKMNKKQRCHYFGSGSYQTFLKIYETFGDHVVSENDSDFIDVETSSDSSNEELDFEQEHNSVDFDNDDDSIHEDVSYLDGAIEFQSGGNSIIDEECAKFLKQSLFEGSEHTMQDVMILLELYKAFTHIGDTNESFLLGIIASVLPRNNLLARCLKKTGFTSYFFQKLISFGTSLITHSSIYKVPVCIKGCMAYVGLHKEASMCNVCQTSRPSLITHSFYYFPLKERLVTLLKSDLFKFFHYPTSRKVPSSTFREDIFDGTAYKWFEDQMQENQYFIGIQFCWDGADIFNFSGKSMWPLAVSILNFPKDIRDKINIGLHVLSLCKGNVLYTCFNIAVSSLCNC